MSKVDTEEPQKGSPSHANGNSSSDNPHTVHDEKSFRFFLTSDGFAGIGSSDTQIGDIICHFYHTKLVLVVRNPESDSWQAICGGVCFTSVKGIPRDGINFNHWAALADWGGLIPKSTWYTKEKMAVYLDIFTLQKFTRYRIYDCSSWLLNDIKRDKEYLRGQHSATASRHTGCASIRRAN